MFFLTDWILIALSTYIVYCSYKKIIYNKYSSMANYIIFVVYIFCCLPILFNYILGIPQYKTVYWYRVFAEPMNNPYIAVIYDFYIGISILLLHMYATHFDRYKSHDKVYKVMDRGAFFTNPIVLNLGVLSPFLYIIICGKTSYYLTYGLNSLRGLEDESFNLIMSTLILLSLYAFGYYIFSRKITKKTILIVAIYSFLLSWIQGKRFILALMGMVYLYYYTKSDIGYQTRKVLAKISPIAFLVLIVFCYFYLVVIRPLSDVSFDSVYEMLRVDFGRDDVIKYVINKEFFEGTHILEYPGQTVLSTLFTYVPRSIWENKPYPHYMYLTASILNCSMFDIPAGTTPSWFEMSLSNFGYMGFVIGAVTLPMICKVGDKLKSIPAQIVVLILVIVLLTQSIDAYVIFLFILFVQVFIKLLLKNKKIKIKWK